jgi:ATP-dependent Lon protease
MVQTDSDELIGIVEDNPADEDLPTDMPLLPIRDVVIFKNMLLPLFVGRGKSVQAVEESLKNNGYLLLIAQKNPGIDKPKTEELYEVGTVGKVVRMMKLSDGQAKVLIQGVARAKIVKYLKKRPLFIAKIEILNEPEIKEIDVKIEALMRNVRAHSEEILDIHGELSNEMSSILENITDPGKLADLAASNLRLKTKESQTLLEIIDPVKRLEKVHDLLSREVELSSVQAKIQSKVTNEAFKSQRDHFLREQVEAIHKELGDNDDHSVEVKEYKKKIKRSKMTKQAEKEALKQLKRFELMHPESGEFSMVRAYLDWLVELPWSKSSKDLIDIKKSEQILNKGHYGLDKVKNRILEYLSVRKLNPKTKGQILCFVGPPGVGKTSLGQAIAHALKRKFFRISLGGIRDEAEIRGHRRTYIGAMPGRIIQGMKQCNTNNPVFMMDEIDKVGTDFRGDPSSALLEVLDPEQNSAFSDNYLNLSFDLSKVMFILTANQTDTIPSALLDRMEVISLSGYTEEEKKIIARKYLLVRQIKENGLGRRKFSITDTALTQIITEFTQEAGLRNLEREIGKICRKVARKIAEGEKGPFNITRKNLQKYLGVPKYYPELDQEESQAGLSTGLAWTQAGGEVLYVEATLIGGKGELIVTGQLGDVMQESARAALSYARANIKSFKIKEKVFENSDIHIHVPAGAIPKDGPSAGIAMATALISALINKPVNKGVAMTGEITLRGRVLPIGGLKEKALGAVRAGIHTIIIPEKNKHDLSEIPENLKKKIKFVRVKNMEQVLDIALKN